MPCCSAYDALSAAPLDPALMAADPLATTPLAATSVSTTSLETAPLAITSLDPITVVARMAPANFDCRRHQCWEALNGGAPCAPGLCVRDEHGKRVDPHARPSCPKHGDGPPDDVQ